MGELEVLVGYNDECDSGGIQHSVVILVFVMDMSHNPSFLSRYPSKITLLFLIAF